MKKFNIRKVLDGLTAASSSSVSSSAQPGTPRDADPVQETLQSEHFQLCKTVRQGFPNQPASMAFDPVQKILAVGTQTGALRLYPFKQRRVSPGVKGRPEGRGQREGARGTGPEGRGQRDGARGRGQRDGARGTGPEGRGHFLFAVQTYMTYTIFEFLDANYLQFNFA
ncbi:hypothetical protein NQD34_015958 [Periophthalmus magnuspinnatus]|nr:hypothetical protein NQD34_015958 [Periophthalmus magnuspinnatus]